MRTTIAIALTLAFSAGAAFAADPPIVRTPIATFAVDPAKSVSQVQAFHAVVAPGQAVPPHYHPAPVVCFVARGAFDFKIGDAPEGHVAMGGAAFEPAGTPVHYFRNASTTEPAELNCVFLAGPDDKTLSVPLDH
jgi:quercetin dioxygenase-like cupin family protein